MKELWKDRYKAALYAVDVDKEVKLNKEGLLEADENAIISNSSIQNGQSIKENVISICLLIYINTVEMFRGAPLMTSLIYS